MKCDFCGNTFDIRESRSGCSGCAMSKSCGKVKCPNCNYEMYPEPELKIFNAVKKWGKKVWKS